LFSSGAVKTPLCHQTREPFVGNEYTRNSIRTVRDGVFYAVRPETIKGVSWPSHSSGGWSRFPPRLPGFELRSGNVGFVVVKVALGQVFSEHFGFPYQFSFHRLLHTHYLSSGAGTIGQLVADVPSGLSLTPLQETEKSS
jgi:hypothetical protein